MRPRSVRAVLLIAAAGASARAGSFEVQVELPQHARIDIEKEGYQTLTVAPFLRDAAVPAVKDDYSFEREATRYFERLFGRETKLKVVDNGDVPLPFASVDAMTKDQGFWKKLSSDAAADLVLTGQVSFKTSNRSGYVENTYQSSITGRSYNDRPTFVYRSGATLTIEVILIEGKSGEILYRDKFLKDRTLEGATADPLQNFFDLIRSLSSNVLALVTPQKTIATRYLLD
ncbi:MAG: hypothetical protein U0166_26865 [Acidobacteriota bacterium]